MLRRFGPGTEASHDWILQNGRQKRLPAGQRTSRFAFDLAPLGLFVAQEKSQIGRLTNRSLRKMGTAAMVGLVKSGDLHSPSSND